MVIAMHEADREHHELREAVFEFTRGARERGQRVERVIIELKELARRAAASGATYAALTALTQCVVGWAIQEYYRRA